MKKRDFHGTYAYKTNKGRVREDNEDQAMVSMNAYGEVFLIVCDGMGGEKKGELASKMAVDSMIKSFERKKQHSSGFLTKRWFAKALKEANDLIYTNSIKNSNYEGMGTTLVACLIDGRNIFICNIGDSRAYIIKDGNLVQLTKDQTYVNYLVSTGEITEEQARVHEKRHVLLNALGIHPSLSYTLTHKKYNGEKILLCSDGLYNNLKDREILAVVTTDERADQKVQNLILEANHNGGTDNIACAFWEIIDHDTNW